MNWFYPLTKFTKRNQNLKVFKLDGPPAKAGGGGSDGSAEQNFKVSIYTIFSFLHLNLCITSLLM